VIWRAITNHKMQTAVRDIAPRRKLRAGINVNCPLYLTPICVMTYEPQVKGVSHDETNEATANETRRTTFRQEDGPAFTTSDRVTRDAN
jgi:hypothetical protein